MLSEIQIFKANQDVTATNLKIFIKLDEGVYDIENAIVQCVLDHAAAGADLYALYRSDYMLNLTEARIVIDGEDRFLCQNLTNLQSLFYFNTSFENQYRKIGVGHDALTRQITFLPLTNTINSTGADGSEAANYKFKKFFPGFQEKYLVVKKGATIFLQFRDLNNLLLKRTSTTGVMAALTTTTFIQVNIYCRKILNADASALNQKKSYINSITQSTTELGYPYSCGKDEVFTMYGFQLQSNTAETALTLASSDAETRVDVSVNQLKIIEATSQAQAYCQANSYKLHQQYPDVISAMFFVPMSGNLVFDVNQSNAQFVTLFEQHTKNIEEKEKK